MRVADWMRSSSWAAGGGGMAGSSFFGGLLSGSSVLRQVEIAFKEASGSRTAEVLATSAFYLQDESPFEDRDMSR